MASPNPTAEQLVEQCQGLVRSLALGVHRKLPPGIELDDLIAYGQVGLVEAAREFDPTRGGRFSTYAYYRVRGAIYDGLAKMSWFGRADQDRVRRQRMSNELLRENGETAGSGEQLDPSAEMRWFRDVTRALAVVYLATQTDEEASAVSASLEDRSAPAAPTVAMTREIVRKLHALIEALPAEASALIRATYFEGLTLQEAGARLGISKSWASRLHAKTLERLARGLRSEEMAG
jgi:RNA polymerase sigma factor for flagellar operon FliA